MEGQIEKKESHRHPEEQRPQPCRLELELIITDRSVRRAGFILYQKRDFREKALVPVTDYTVLYKDYCG